MVETLGRFHISGRELSLASQEIGMLVVSTDWLGFFVELPQRTVLRHFINLKCSSQSLGWAVPEDSCPCTFCFVTVLCQRWLFSGTSGLPCWKAPCVCTCSSEELQAWRCSEVGRQLRSLRRKCFQPVQWILQVQWILIHAGFLLCVTGFLAVWFWCVGA